MDGDHLVVFRVLSVKVSIFTSSIQMMLFGWSNNLSHLALSNGELEPMYYHILSRKKGECLLSSPQQSLNYLGTALFIILQEILHDVEEKGMVNDEYIQC